ncbi:BTB:POZ domain containing isoform 1 [Schistosoma japonicum]|uniref:BTB:POZ domain containing isoform 1 n=3 Tax=Schistosoma japonicum TaxID=6182 RepID=A0A4Z2DLD4_SCHJA|nr:BTB:POZ domain containing [Schistosoma japonicum]TNN17279.1 BTB:POZ domain containing isoform 1 [Schistosoma japonicum]
MASGLITLIAENQSFQVPRDVLAKSSLYFHAAFESGMAESKTSQFSFPNFTAHQLAMVVQFLRPEMTAQNDALNIRTSGFNNSCPETLKILEVLDLVDAADYFQMPELIQACVQRTSHFMDELFQPKSIRLHESHNCDIFSTILKEFVKVSQCENSRVSKLFSEYTIKYPHFILRPCLSDSNLQRPLINLVISYLSRSIICIPDEDIILNIVLSWLQLLESTQFYTDDIIQCFLQCIRPGLLSLHGQEKLLGYWRSQHSEFKWFGKLTYYDMQVFFKSIPHGGIFFRCPLASQFQLLLLKPRAESLCLLGLAPSHSSNSLEFWFFNLHNGSYHNYPIPHNCLRELDLDSSGVGDIDHRIYFCPVTYGPGSYHNSLFVICFDPNNATLNGFAWCLASCRAKPIPRLFLSPPSNKNGTVNSFCFRSRRIGLTTLSTGLYMYYVSTIQEVAWLCAFRFDLSTWNWYQMQPYCLSKSQNGIMLFTPIEQLNSIPPDDWVYANVETVSSSNNSRHPRHGLHQTSALRSQFFRFRPQPDNYSFVVENLPNPPFLIRMYRLLAISCSVQTTNYDNTYLFPMGTCSRDIEATHYCFDTFSSQWLRWRPVQMSDIDESNPIRQYPSEDIELIFNLCPKILGFRGLVCATHLLHELGGNESSSKAATVENSDAVDSCSHLHSSAMDDQSHNKSLNFANKNKLATFLVLAGRPDQNKHVTCGIWFHNPQPCNNSNEAVPLFDSQKPHYFLPAAVAQTLGQYLSPTAVVLANWTHIIQSSNPITFFDDSSEQENCELNKLSHINEYISEDSNWSCDSD